MRLQILQLYLGETGVDYWSPQPFVQNNGKSNLFSQNWSENDGKTYRLQDFYDIFYLHDWAAGWQKGPYDKI